MSILWYPVLFIICTLLSIIWLVEHWRAPEKELPPKEAPKIEELPDWLDEEFKILEAEVRRRDCKHLAAIELTDLGTHAQYLCSRCGSAIPKEDLPK